MDKQNECQHYFIHIITDEEMLNQYGKRWRASRIVIYCQKCGKIVKDRIENSSAV